MGGSAPCLLHELGADDSVPPDRVQARDVARFRKVERERLLVQRQGLAVETRAQETAAIAAALAHLLPASAQIISLYWPIKAEPDLRSWMRVQHEAGHRVALPVASALGHPLTFREWRPGTRMAHGLWGIPHPAEGAQVQPTVILAPLVGFDAAGFRLGYGGGFFDRTLAALHPRPRVIGVGYACSAIRTIFPQPHDIGMDWIVTGDAPRHYPRP